MLPPGEGEFLKGLRVEAMTRRNAVQRAAIVTAWSLSLSRLVFACLFPLVSGPWGIGLVALAAASDGLDGLVARRLGARTKWGAVVDPLTDKIFTWTVLAVLGIRGDLGVPWLIALVSRDGVVLGGGLRLAWKLGRSAVRVLEPRLSGKATTAAQFALFLVLLAWPQWKGSSVLVAATALLTLLAAVDYGWYLHRISISECIES